MTSNLSFFFSASLRAPILGRPGLWIKSSLPGAGLPTRGSVWACFEGQEKLVHWVRKAGQPEREGGNCPERSDADPPPPKSGHPAALFSVPAKLTKGVLKFDQINNKDARGPGSPVFGGVGSGDVRHPAHAPPPPLVHRRMHPERTPALSTPGWPQAWSGMPAMELVASGAYARNTNAVEGAVAAIAGASARAQAVVVVAARAPLRLCLPPK